MGPYVHVRRTCRSLYRIRSAVILSPCLNDQNFRWLAGQCSFVHSFNFYSASSSPPGQLFLINWHSQLETHVNGRWSTCKRRSTNA